MRDRKTTSDDLLVAAMIFLFNFQKKLIEEFPEEAERQRLELISNIKTRNLTKAGLSWLILRAARRSDNDEAAEHPDAVFESLIGESIESLATTPLASENQN